MTAGACFQVHHNAMLCLQVQLIQSRGRLSRLSRLVWPRLHKQTCLKAGDLHATTAKQLQLKCHLLCRNHSLAFHRSRSAEEPCFVSASTQQCYSRHVTTSGLRLNIATPHLDKFWELCTCQVQQGFGRDALSALSNPFQPVVASSCILNTLLVSIC